MLSYVDMKTFDAYQTWLKGKEDLVHKLVVESLKEAIEDIESTPSDDIDLEILDDLLGVLGYFMVPSEFTAWFDKKVGELE